ncbi:hypothetical protein [Paraburkholderia acidipaludis]|uniref:hypothetical protein n=1 Tax=Paraburkholderia acidipaludis TaxID=660537 RepID=UPI0012EB406C|nr:hypothetical protein [Paraburkholderia acidipaludis]
MRRPRFHHRAALFQKVCAVIGCLNLVRHGMRERPLGKVAGAIFSLAGPSARWYLLRQIAASGLHGGYRKPEKTKGLRVKTL